MPAPGESSGEPSGAKGGPAGENKKSRLAEWRARDYKFIRFLRISSSDGSCGKIASVSAIFVWPHKQKLRLSARTFEKKVSFQGDNFCGAAGGT